MNNFLDLDLKVDDLDDFTNIKEQYLVESNSRLSDKEKEELKRFIDKIEEEGLTSLSSETIKQLNDEKYNQQNEKSILDILESLDEDDDILAALSNPIYAEWRRHLGRKLNELYKKFPKLNDPLWGQPEEMFERNVASYLLGKKASKYISGFREGTYLRFEDTIPIARKLLLKYKMKYGEDSISSYPQENMKELAKETIEEFYGFTPTDYGPHNVRRD